MSIPLSHFDIISHLPDHGLFRRQSGQRRLPWLTSPRPFELNKKQVKDLQSLGHILSKFYEACDRIYQASAKGRLPAWISALLDTGKPDFLVRLQRSTPLRDSLPRVIRPDLMLTETGFSLTELDSVPGGIGITQWLSRLYSEQGWSLFGGSEGMAEGFQSILPEGADILVSEEAADYRPEMSYLAQTLGENYRVCSAENYIPTGNPVYRFFELFDLPHIPGSHELLDTLSSVDKITPPAKPHLEEKLWLALFHCPGLRAIWKTHLREKHLQRLESLIPHSWMMDPAPLPAQASLPWLNVNSWEDVSHFSQKKRRLVAKVSGFSEKAWGARGVHIGHDLPTDQWEKVVRQALDEFTTSPWLMQEFITSQPVEHPYYDPENGEERIMKGFVRLCPYYFRTSDGHVQPGGSLATIVPLDKKKIHGMSDAILVPCSTGTM